MAEEKMLRCVPVARRPYYVKRQWEPAGLLYSDIATGNRLSKPEAQERKTGQGNSVG